MHVGKLVFAQVMEFAPWHTFRRLVAKYRGDFNVRTFSCLDQFLCMAFAQLTYRESLRDIEACLGAQPAKLYHLGIRGTSIVYRSKSSEMNRKVAGVLLLFILVTPVIVSAELTSVVLAAVVLVLSALNFPYVRADLVRFIGPLLLLIVVGTAGAFDSVPYNVFKDIWYVGKPILAIMAGYLLMLILRDVALLSRIIVLAACISALAHLSQFVIDPIALSKSVVDIRESAGTGYYITAVGLGVLATGRSLKVHILGGGTLVTVAVIIVCITSLVLAYSRTQWVCLAILLFASTGILVRAKARIIIVFMMMIIVLFVLSMVIPRVQQIGSNTSFMGKLAYSINEIVIADYSAPAEINQNWRGYESYRAFATYLKGSPTEYILGQGFGTLVDLGFSMKLGDEELRYIPIFHNGYIYVLLKTGVIGLLLYAWFFRQLLRLSRTRMRNADLYHELLARVFSGLGWMLIVTTLVITGLFSKSSLLPVVVVIGSMSAYLHAYKRRVKVESGVQPPPSMS